MAYIGATPTAVPLTGADIEDGTIQIADLSATGTKDATTFLRGDNTFASALPTPAWSVTNAANQSLSDDVLTRVVFDTEVLDTDNAFASNVFTVPSGKGGKYFIGFRVFVDDIDALDYCMAYLEVNDVAEGGTDVRVAHSSTTNVNLHSNTLIDLSAGDVVEVVCKITGAGTQELRSGTFNTLFYGWKVA